jgi:hypothetical protein
MFLMSKHHTSGTFGGQSKHFIVRCGVVFGVASDMFHGVPIGDGVHKVEVQGAMLLETFLMFSNSKDDLVQGCEGSIHTLGGCKYVKTFS